MIDRSEQSGADGSDGCCSSEGRLLVLTHLEGTLGGRCLVRTPAAIPPRAPRGQLVAACEAAAAAATHEDWQRARTRYWPGNRAWTWK